MEKKHLIGKKVRGFRFRETEYGLFFDPRMRKHIGSIGIIKEGFMEDSGEVTIEFEDGRTWRYPLSEIEKHLVIPSQYEVGMTVHDYEFGEGVIVRINERMAYPIEVKFKMRSEDYTMEGGCFKSPMNSTPRRLSLTPYDLVNGGATFPTFKPELPEIEKGTLVFVKTGFKWEMRFFSHFDESANIYCFINQEKSGKAESWPEYSLTNPLIED